MFKLIGNEFTFDVDLSQLPCGLNGALYFVSMPQKGHGTPGAKYGTGEFNWAITVWSHAHTLQGTVTLSALVT
jgi:hypothetical protein